MADNSGRITSFDKSHYEQLITYLKTVDDGINTSEYALGPSAKLKLDSTLSTTFHPGSDSWPLAKGFVTQAGTFGRTDLLQGAQERRGRLRRYERPHHVRRVQVRAGPPRRRRRHRDAVSRSAD
jgi:hypothetical protein